MIHLECGRLGSLYETYHAEDKGSTLARRERVAPEVGSARSYRGVRARQARPAPPVAHWLGVERSDHAVRAKGAADTAASGRRGSHCLATVLKFSWGWAVRTACLRGGLVGISTANRERADAEVAETTGRRRAESVVEQLKVPDQRQHAAADQICQGRPIRGERRGKNLREASTYMRLFVSPRSAGT